MPAERLHDLVERKIPTAPCWIEPGILPKNGICVVGGEAKIGKTFNIISGYGKALSCQEDLYGNPDWIVPQACRVLVIEQELGPYILQKRVKSIFDNSNLKYFKDNLWVISKEPSLKLDTAFDKIREEIDQVQPNVLILDPISNFHTGDENSAREVEFLVNQIKTLLRQYRELDLSIIFTHHFGKPPNPQFADDIDRLSPYAFRGSSKWYDAVDTAHTIIKTQTNMRRDEKSGQQWLSWTMKNRFTLRATEPPKDFYTKFNADNDQCVKFDRYEGEASKTAPPLKMKRIPTKVVDSQAKSAIVAEPGQANLRLEDFPD